MAVIEIAQWFEVLETQKKKFNLNLIYRLLGIFHMKHWE